MLNFLNNIFQWIYNFIANAINGKYLLNNINSINIKTLKYLAIILLVIAVFNSLFFFEKKFLKEKN